MNFSKNKIEKMRTLCKKKIQYLSCIYRDNKFLTKNNFSELSPGGI